ncbi:MAG: hypothetical protein Q4E05_09010 [Pseudoclavibacter sp.]|nr:hypothetical protein [Pseudoclavibacter sp.]
MRTVTGARSCIAELSEDWRARHAERAEEYGELGRCRGGELIARIRGAGRAERDRIVGELLRLAQSGHGPSERLLLVLMLPRVVRIARSSRCLHALPRRDAQAIALGAMWEAVRSAPADGTGLLCRLALDALRIVTRSHALLVERREEPVDADGFQLLEHERGGGADEAARELAEVFDWALEQGVIDRREARVLATVELGDLRDRSRLAREFGVDPASLQRRAHRIRRRMQAAVRAEIDRNGRW